MSFVSILLNEPKTLFKYFIYYLEEKLERFSKNSLAVGASVGVTRLTFDAQRDETARPTTENIFIIILIFLLSLLLFCYYYHHHFYYYYYYHYYYYFFIIINQNGLFTFSHELKSFSFKRNCIVLY